jgi:hypothetical protein
VTAASASIARKLPPSVPVGLGGPGDVSLLDKPKNMLEQAQAAAISQIARPPPPAAPKRKPSKTNNNASGSGTDVSDLVS